MTQETLDKISNNKIFNNLFRLFGFFCGSVFLYLVFSIGKEFISDISRPDHYTSHSGGEAGVMFVVLLLFIIGIGFIVDSFTRDPIFSITQMFSPTQNPKQEKIKQS